MMRCAMRLTASSFLIGVVALYSYTAQRGAYSCSREECPTRRGTGSTVCCQGPDHHVHRAAAAPPPPDLLTSSSISQRGLPFFRRHERHHQTSVSSGMRSFARSVIQSAQRMHCAQSCTACDVRLYFVSSKRSLGHRSRGAFVIQPTQGPGWRSRCWQPGVPQTPRPVLGRPETATAVGRS